MRVDSIKLIYKTDACSYASSWRIIKCTEFEKQEVNCLILICKALMKWMEMDLKWKSPQKPYQMLKYALML